MVTAKQGFAEIMANSQASHNAYLSTNKYSSAGNSYKNKCIKFETATK
jgi:hypothetical protein